MSEDLKTSGTTAKEVTDGKRYWKSSVLHL